MPKYISYFSYTRDAAKAMIERPTDRVAAAKALVESAGGTLECFYWTQGDHDGFFIADYPDGATAAAVAVAASSTGAISRVASHELFDGAGQRRIMDAARTALAGYSPPTA